MNDKTNETTPTLPKRRRFLREASMLYNQKVDDGMSKGKAWDEATREAGTSIFGSGTGK